MTLAVDARRDLEKFRQSVCALLDGRLQPRPYNVEVLRAMRRHRFRTVGTLEDLEGFFGKRRAVRLAVEPQEPLDYGP